MTKAHEALDELERYNLTYGARVRRAAPVREALFTHDELLRITEWYNPDYASEEDEALMDKMWKILGVTG